MNLVQALQYLRPNAQWVLNGEDISGLVWLDQTQSRPTNEEIAAALTLPAPKRPTSEDFKAFIKDCFNTPELKNIFERIKFHSVQDSPSGRLVASAYADLIGAGIYFMEHNPPTSGGYGLALVNLANALQGTADALTSAEKKIINDALQAHNLARVLS